MKTVEFDEEDGGSSPHGKTLSCSRALNIEFANVTAEIRGEEDGVS